MEASEKYFSSDYATARTRFREAVSRAGGTVVPLAIGALGPRGEELTIDIGWFGELRPAQALIHSSGVHGVEGFAGSAIQLQWLDQSPPAAADGRAIVLVHIVNPYGMAWLRRVNEHNVDLNRNCLGPHESYGGAPPGYEALDSFLNPSDPESRAAFYLRAANLIRTHGLAVLRQTIGGGQYVNPKGLFFGGTGLEPETQLLLQLLRERLPVAARVIGVDVHTGLGRFGIDTLIANDPPDSMGFELLRQVFGNRVVSSDARRGPVYRATGTLDELVRQAAPGAKRNFIVQEFGTYHAGRVLRALRAENFRRQYGSASRSAGRTDAALVHVFIPRSASWRSSVLDRGRAVLRAAMDALNERT